MSRVSALLLLALLGCGGRVVDEAPPVDAGMEVSRCGVLDPDPVVRIVISYETYVGPHDVRTLDRSCVLQRFGISRRIDDDACHALFAKLDCVAVREAWKPCCEGHDGWTRGQVVLASGATREFDARGVCHGLGITCPF
ncbi:MAG: hypothetical protein JNL79_38395 [Myxococcales bacterium]|nr:hypothetical protein [Myxococcales bacterium]